MIRRLLGIVLLVAVSGAGLTLHAKRTLENPGSYIDEQFYTGYNFRVDEEGDTVLVLYLKDLPVYRPMTFKNQKQQDEYWRTVRNVKLTLPYAKLIAETLTETYEYIQTMPTAKEREAYLKKFEKALYNQYKPVLRKFSKTQAKILIKLIQRETHQSSYDIVKAFMGTFRASFWQGFGKLFGVSLKSSFDPAKNNDDATLQRIASLVERGLL